jgi:hypothetical protein
MGAVARMMQRKEGEASMRRMVVVLCLVALAFTLAPTKVSAVTSSREPGGAMAFIVGCLMGPREGTQWNEGRTPHWREWVPLVCPVFAVWNGVECYKGMTTRDFAEKYGANWY